MDNAIKEFEEKPAEPKSNLASMGIYIFSWPLLRQALVEDAANPDSDHDFGKDIIPTLLEQKKRLYAYRFEGYWKDVGTIDSLWEANMDLIDHNDELNLGDREWKIYTADIPTLPHYVGPTGHVEHCYINQGAVIHGNVKDSVLFNGVEIAKGAEVIQSVLMPGVKIGPDAKVYRSIVADKVEIGAGQVVGAPDSEKIQLIAADVKGGK
jgi:glucose-1-phosphate adenylyltransferase